MAFIHGSKSYFSFNTHDLSADLDGVDLDQVIDLAETSTFGNTFKTFVSGLTDATFSVTFVFEAGSSSNVDDVLGADDRTAKAFEYRASNAGVGAGNPKYTGTALLKDYKISSKINAAVRGTATFQCTSAVGRATS
jgi:hypothetical protein